MISLTVKLKEAPLELWAAVEAGGGVPTGEHSRTTLLNNMERTTKLNNIR